MRQAGDPGAWERVGFHVPGMLFYAGPSSQRCLLHLFPGCRRSLDPDVLPQELAPMPTQPGSARCREQTLAGGQEVAVVPFGSSFALLWGLSFKDLSTLSSPL